MPGGNPSADSGARTEAGCRRCPVWFPELRTWRHAINPIKKWPRSLFLVRIGRLHFRSPASRPTFEEMTVMQEPVEHCRDGRGIAE